MNGLRYALSLVLFLYITAYPFSSFYGLTAQCDLIFFSPGGFHGVMVSTLDSESTIRVQISVGLGQCSFNCSFIIPAFLKT